MDHEAQKKKRMEELEAKRKRLEEMRKMRQNRAEQAAEPVTTVENDTPSESSNVEDLVNSLLTEPIPEAIEALTLTVASTPAAITESAPPPLTRLDYAKIRSRELTTVQDVIRIHIEPVVTETYAKECQTDELFDDIDDRNSESEHTPHRRPHSESGSIKYLSPPPASGRYQASPDGARRMLLSNDEEDVSEAMKQLSLEDVNTIMEGETFRTFLSKSSHIVNRALGLSSAIDILKDYTGADKERTSDDDRNAVMNSSRTFTNSAVNNRPIMDVQVEIWNHHYPPPNINPHHAELFLVSYGSQSTKGIDNTSNVGKSAEGGGLVCVWSVILEDEPEFTFTSHSPVLTARFHPGDPHIVFGGCYSGQIVMWDTRVASSRPTMRSSFAGRGHKHPVYSMVIERSNRSNATLITASTDGQLCHWDISNLVNPISTTNLMGIAMTPSLPLTKDLPTITGEKRTISPSCMTLGPIEDNRKLVIGSEGGALCVFHLPFKPNAAFEQVAAHFGMITSVHINPAPSKQFKHLTLTSSVDWSIKLWNIDDISMSSTPLLEFTASTFDYFCSVRWSSSHPGVFSCITSGGILMLWNICQSVLEPVGTLKVTASEKHTELTSPANAIGCALNKSVWLDDGRKLLVGDSRGHTSLISIRPSAITLRTGDEQRLESALHVNSSKISSLSSTRLPAQLEEGAIGEGEYKR